METGNKTLRCLLLMVFFCGCANIRPVPEIRSQSLGTHLVSEKNYQLARKLSAHVGEPMIQVKEQSVERLVERPMEMQAEKDFVMTGGHVTMSGEKDTRYPVRAEITLDKQTYYAVDLPGSPNPVYSALIDEEGRVYHKALDGNNIIMWDFTIMPSDFVFEFSREERTHEVVKSGKVFELIYGGTDGKTVYITYKEFAAEDLSKPVFFQNLIYKADSEFVRFRNIEIKIHEASHEKVVFTVIKD